MSSPKQIQIQIDEVTTLMKKNMEDVIKRDIKLDDLTVKSEDLLDGMSTSRHKTYEILIININISFFLFFGIFTIFF